MIRGNYVSVVTLLIAGVLLAGCHGDPSVRKQKYLESGNRFSASGSYKEASIQYLNALKVDEDFAEAHYLLAHAYEHLGQFNAAISELGRTVDLSPRDYAARIELGNLQFAADRTDEAEEQATAVDTAQPDNAAAHALLSAVAARRGHKERALDEIRRAVSLEPNVAAYHENLALLLADTPATSSAAEEELKRAISIDPRAVNARLLLAAFYARHNRTVEAEKVGWGAVAADPASIAARTNVAQIILKRGDNARAEEVLRQASKDFADNPQGVSLLADYYVGTGQFEKARAELETLVKTHPGNDSLHKFLIRVLLQTENYPAARTEVAELVKSRPHDPEVAALNGAVILGGGNANAAETALQASAHDFPNDASIQYWLGKAALAKGDCVLAEASFRQAAELNPSSRETQVELARLAMLSGDIPLVESAAGKTIAADPRSPDGYVWRALAEMRRNASDAAEADLKSALSISPQNSQAYLQLGKLLFSQNRFAEGTAALRQALQYDAGCVEAARILAGYNLYMKQPVKAVNLINALIARSPQNSGFYDLLAQLQVQDKQLEQASATAQKAIQLNPNDGDAVMLFVRIAVQRGTTGNAVDAWQKRANEHPDDASAWAILGSLEESRGALDKAESYYQKSLNIRPQQPVAANNLAYRLLETGKSLDKALTLALNARLGMPDSPNTADTLAWAYYAKGSYQLARNLLEDAVAANPESGTIQYHLGMVCAKLGDHQNASIHLKKAMALSHDTQTAREAQQALLALG